MAVAPILDDRWTQEPGAAVNNTGLTAHIGDLADTQFLWCAKCWRST